MAPRTVLIADDDPATTKALAIWFERLGLATVESSNVLHALFGAQASHPALIVLDVNMPSGNGLAACEILSTDETCADIPVIIYTGRSDEETIQRCRQLGAHYVRRTSGFWSDLAPLVCELLDIDIIQVRAAWAGDRQVHESFASTDVATS